MTSDDAPEHDPSSSPQGGESGLFSQLPHSRPGVRSPRRKGGDTGRQASSGKQPAGSQPAAIRAAEAAARARIAVGEDPLDPPSARRRKQPSPSPSEQRPHETQTPPSQEQQSLGPGSLEDLAWAGVAVTAEAATLGIRLLGRAVDAAKRATERS
jgi:hypothetical protein